MNNHLFCDMSLKTERLIIRPFKPADAKQLHSIVSQPKVLKFLPEDVMTLEEVRHVIEWLQTCYQQNIPEKILKWTLGVIWYRTSEVIGWCGLGPLDFSPKETELFCGLSELYWGRGIAAEACRAVLDYAFTNIGLTRIVAVIDPENLQSRRLIEKLGMQLEKQVHGLPEEFQHYEGFLHYSLHNARQFRSKL
jgi:[ribosomal protein S5]-alanine N-acetyltransferase